MEAWKELDSEAHFYLIKTLLFVIAAVPDASLESPYKASRPTPATCTMHTSTYRPCHTNDSKKGFTNFLFQGASNVGIMLRGVACVRTEGVT